MIPESSILRLFTEPTGTLGVIEFDDLPFTPQRFFWLTEIDRDEMRADHGHRTCHQLLVCLKGTLTATVTYGQNQERIIPMSSGSCLHLEPLQWLQLTDFSADSVLGVFASTPYDPNEYVRSRDELQKLWDQSSKD